MTGNVAKEIRRKLKRKANPLSKERLKWARKIVGPDFLPYGVKLADVWKITRDVYKEHQNKLDLETAWKVGEKLIASPYQEEKLAAFGLVGCFQKEFGKDALSRFKVWIEKYVTNWGVCDSSCINVIGPYLAKDLQLLPEMERWAASKNLWVQRASLVATLKTASSLENPQFLFLMAEKFMESKEPFLQKATGWLLKESSKYFPEEVVKFLLKWKLKTSRLILRYGTEKMDDRQRKVVLS